ncbi:GPI ethanolamine phosphate transferase 3-like [Homarus americanus]|uniref:GPI ethanolamine phosphate transferase 3-like n=1 Tax=Homarus americanus TaxID=6706 RepID=UPI001C46A2FD|nr:GPI ethanolamine phosphate transferase 3-like [Homarus americanus]
MAGFGSSQVFILILCFSELVVVGLLIFSHGFLLTRQVVMLNSSCEDFKMGEIPFETKNDGTNIGKTSKDGCWMPPTFKKAVVLLIDALRYDFAIYNHSLKDEDALPYQNKMPIFSNLVKDRPRQAHLVPFIADAPTTTMQRLKGLTTGSLPTFIDVSHNFASEEISEDNIVDQLVSCGRRVIILGDDTWGGLFPGRFNQSFLYPSFNVMDLHSVDNSVKKHLEQEMMQEEWDVIIGHFLGVDHCGHRYGPNHPEMAAKLKQMNYIIEKVANGIGNETVLFVFGDHGMTRTGDHGGDSDDELKAALFVYSPALDMTPSVSEHEHPLSVAQVDFVPTLALALGIPIPYSNLGKVMDRILVTVGQTGEEAEQRQLVALAQNVKQVKRYLKDYKNLGNVFPSDLWHRIESLHSKMSLGFEKLPVREQKRVYTEYLTLAKIMCEEVWAKFNMSEMMSGLLLMFIVLTLMLVVTYYKCMLRSKIPVRLLYLTVMVNALFLFIPYCSISVLGYIASFFILIWIYFHRQVMTSASFYINASDSISLLLSFLLCVGSFSNSYVVVENYVVAFILISCLVIQLFIPLFKRQRKRGFNISSTKSFKLSINFYSILYIVTLSVLFFSVRLSSWFWKCREEQSWCTPGQVHTPMTGLPQSLRNWRYFTSLFALILLVWLPRRWLLMCGNMNGSRLGVILYNSVPVVCGVLVAGHWALQAAPTLHNLKVNEYVVILPRISYALALIYTAILYLVPLLIYEVPPSKSKTNIQSVMENPSALIPRLCQTLVEKYKSDGQKGSNIPIVYGLATAVSAPLVTVLTVTLVVIVMVAGDGIAPAVVFLLLTAIACLFLQAATSWRTADNSSIIMKPSWSATCVWFMLSIHGFYSTGHQATFPSLHWSAAFVGFEGEWSGSNLIPAFLVGLNTFSSQILFGFSLPLVLLAPLTMGVIFPKLRSNSNRLESEKARRGEFLLVDEPDKAEDALIFLGFSYTFLHAAKMFCSAMSAFILRRHLMVWKIFAPHFIFEAVGFIVTNISVLTGIWFTLRVLKVLSSWSDSLYCKIS